MRFLNSLMLICLGLTGISQTLSFKSENVLYAKQLNASDSAIGFDKLSEFPELEDVSKFPTICPDFNVVGQKACLRYVIDRGIFELEDFYKFNNYESFSGRVYFRQGKPIALRLFEPPLEPATAETAFKNIQDYYYAEFKPKELKQMNSFYM